MTLTCSLRGRGKEGVYEIPITPPTKLRESVARVRFVPFAGKALGFGKLVCIQSIRHYVAVLSRLILMRTRCM